MPVVSATTYRLEILTQEVFLMSAGKASSLLSPYTEDIAFLVPAEDLGEEGSSWETWYVTGGIG